MSVLSFFFAAHHSSWIRDVKHHMSRRCDVTGLQMLSLDDADCEFKRTDRQICQKESGIPVISLKIKHHSESEWK